MSGRRLIAFARSTNIERSGVAARSASICEIAQRVRPLTVGTRRLQPPGWTRWAGSVAVIAADTSCNGPVPVASP
jgi:hypothetical protein